MPFRLLVDTDLLVEYLRGRQEAADWLESQEAELAVSAITVAEPHPLVVAAETP